MMNLGLIRLILFLFEFISSSVVEQREHSNHKLPFKKRRLENMQTDNFAYFTKPHGKFQYPDMCVTTNNSLINKADVSLSKYTTSISKANNDNETDRDACELTSRKEDKKITTINNCQSLINIKPKREKSLEQIYSYKRNNLFYIGESSIYLLKQVKSHKNSSESLHINSKLRFTTEGWPRFLNEKETKKLKIVLSKSLIIPLNKKKAGKNLNKRLNRACTIFSEIFIILCLEVKSDGNEETLIEFFKFFLMNLIKLNLILEIEIIFPLKKKLK